MKGSVAAAIAVAVLTAFPAYPQSQNEVAQQLRSAFVSCVWGAVLDTENMTSNLRMKVEQSFLACKTEEDTIIAFLRASNIAPTQASVILATIKTQIKSEILSAGRN